MLGFFDVLGVYGRGMGELPPRVEIRCLWVVTSECVALGGLDWQT